MLMIMKEQSGFSPVVDGESESVNGGTAQPISPSLVPIIIAEAVINCFQPSSDSSNDSGGK